MKFPLITSLAYDFLLSLLENADISADCHRNGQRSRNLSTPLYRVRLALSRL